MRRRTVVISSSFTVNPNSYVVYGHYDGKIPFYIGGGKSERAFAGTRNNKWHEKVQQLRGVYTIRILGIFSNRKACFDEEKRLILKYNPSTNINGRENNVYENGCNQPSSRVKATGSVNDIKRTLAMIISRILKSDTKVWENTGIARQEWSLIRCGDLAGFKIDRLFEFIERLGYDIEIDLKLTKRRG